MRLALHTFLTLDGVMQAPGGPEEDTTGGFQHGGWSFLFADDDFGKTVIEWMGHADAFLLGRKTYDIFAGYWPKSTDPDDQIATRLNTLPKYVASRSLRSADWNNTTILTGDVTTEVTRLKERPGDEIQVLGSGELAQTLIRDGLVDVFRLAFFPVHLGSGRKLFRDGLSAGSLRLINTKTTDAGVIMSTYETAGPVQHGEFTIDEQ